MKKLFSFFTITAFLSVSFLAASHVHHGTEAGCKDDCPLCVFSQTIPVVSSACTVPLAPVIFQEIAIPPARKTVAASLFVIPDPRAPPLA